MVDPGLSKGRGAGQNKGRVGIADGLYATARGRLSGSGEETDDFAQAKKVWWFVTAHSE